MREMLMVVVKGVALDVTCCFDIDQLTINFISEIVFSPNISAEIRKFKETSSNYYFSGPLPPPVKK